MCPTVSEGQVAPEPRLRTFRGAQNMSFKDDPAPLSTNWKNGERKIEGDAAMQQLREGGREGGEVRRRDRGIMDGRIEGGRWREVERDGSVALSLSPVQRGIERQG